MSDKKYRMRFSRKNAIEHPNLINLLGYIHQKHNFPNYGWENNGLRYHYTDAAGLQGMIQSGRLWATDIRFLNDPSEGTFFTERLLARMESKPGGISDTEKKIIKGLKTANDNPVSNYTSFCVSLSANGDLLSQWRGYGNFGKGYAVGLRFGIDLPDIQIAGYYDVVYGDEGVEDLAFDLLDLFRSAFEKWKEFMYDEWAFTLNYLAKTFKNYSYSEEKESRLMTLYSDKIEKNFQKELPLKFRVKGSDLIPYIPLSLGILKVGEEPKLPIEKIVIGPGVDFDRNSSSIKALLKAHSYNDVKIEPSIIPFRP